MINFFNKNRKIVSSLIAGLLVCSFVLAPIAQNSNGQYHVQTAHATVVEDVLNQPSNWGTWITNIANKAYNAVTSAMAQSLNLKEYTLDAILWALVNLMLEQMIRSTTQWVASGFQGSPAFVTDLQGFAMGLGDKVAGRFIQNVGLSALCSPFKLNIQAALTMQYASSRSYGPQTCTLTSVSNNVSNFMEGDFLQGGWNEWFRMTQTPKNNQYGAMMEATAAMSATIRNSRGEEIKLLDFGKGLMSLKDANGKVITPGTSIESTLSKALDIPAERLTVADEINELLGVLISQLVKTAMSSASGGLAGLGTSGQNASYWDSSYAQSTQQGSTNSGGLFGDALGRLNTNIGLQDAIISSITAMTTWKSTCDTGGVTPDLTTHLANAQAARASDTNVLNAITVFQSDYAALGNGDTTIIAKYVPGYIPGETTAGEAQLALIDQYNSYVNSGAIPSLDQNITIETTFIPAINSQIQNLKEFYEQACSSAGTG
jgi:hypothetical protein